METNLKSKVISYAQYKDLDLDQLIPPFEYETEKLEKDVSTLLKKHAEMVDADSVEEYDFVTLSCKSDMPRFNKSNITLRVGKGLFNRELEKALIGIHKGENKQIVVGGANVQVDITKITRAIEPSLNDETVASWNIKGVKTVAQLKNKLKTDQRLTFIEDYSESITSEIMTVINEQSQFDLNEEDIAASKEEGRKMLWSMLDGCGVNADTATDEEVTAVSGMTLEENITHMENMFVDGLKSTLIAMEYAKKAELAFDPDMYEKRLSEQAEFMEISIAEMKKIFTEKVFMKQCIDDYYFGLIEDHVKNYLLERKS